MDLERSERNEREQSTDTTSALLYKQGLGFRVQGL